MATTQNGAGPHASKRRPKLTSVATVESAAPPPADMPLPATMDREQRIAQCAYLRAAERGFAPGHELEDWLAAERELEANGEIVVTRST